MAFPVRERYAFHMSEMESRSHSPGLVATILFVFQVIGMAIMGATGTMAKLPEGVQFFLGLEAVGFPLLVYFLLKRRQNNGQ